MTVELQVTGLFAGYDGRDILHGVDLRLPAGGALTVIGPNGSGKSTLLKTVVGLVPVSAGSIRLGGRDVTVLDAPGRARCGLAYVPQERNVFRNMDVLDNLRTGGEFLLGRHQRGELQARIERSLELFPELRPHLRKPAGLLSGGQRQMVAMASALMQQPALLVLDEPSAGLSPRNAGLLFEAVARIRQTGISLLLIEQNVALGLAAAQAALVLVAGQVRHLGPAAELAGGADLHRLFFGSTA
ncbi:ATP-binding cassette domain-containing protein [Xylophilus sp. Kf1]|nr:ATP-binding cassette domain-containing protein [Xylophilus sp. Kf1]